MSEVYNYTACKSIFRSSLLFLLLFSNSLHASETGVIQNKDIIIEFEKPLQNTAQEVADMYPAVKAELEDTFGWKIDFRPTVMILKEGETFKRIVHGRHVVAIAIPQNNLMVFNSTKANTHPFSLEITLKHELCHLLLRHYIKKGNLPKWFNEGVSQWVSGGIAEVIMGEDSKNVLKEATLSKKFISLRELTWQFPADEKSFRLAYEESKSIVEYIIREFEPDGLVRILNHLRHGDEIEGAVQKGLGIPLEELEKRWHNHLIKRFTWASYLSNNIYKILFFCAGLLTVYGFIKLIMKKRAYKDDDILDTDV
jgi:hypothetical protein